MDWLVAFIFARALERIVIVIISGFSLWMGWQLFLRLPRTNQQAEFGYKGLTVKLIRVGPGVFFALFGAALLGATFWHLPKADDAQRLQEVSASQQTGSRHVEMANEANPKSLEEQITGLNVVLSVALQKPEEPVEAIDRTRIANSRMALESLRNRLLAERFGAEAFAQWLANRDQYRTSPLAVPAGVRDNVKNVEELAVRLNVKG
jgi:hypothetical protein